MFEEYYIWLQSVFGQGSVRIDEILSKFDTAKDFYDNRGDAANLLVDLKMSELDKIKKISLDSAKIVADRYRKLGVNIVTPLSDEFPERLRDISGMPAALYVVGDISNIDNEVAVAMVGTRRHTAFGEIAATTIATELALGGAVVVSGLAVGIDSCCHRAAVDAGKRTLGFLACGLDVDYPKPNASLKREICDLGGAVISEYQPGERPLSGHFHARNRLISGISLATVVVQAPNPSGALITANHALEQGKDVFSVFGFIMEKENEGNVILIKDGARPITKGVEVLAEYTSTYPNKINIEKAIEYRNKYGNKIRKDFRQALIDKAEVYRHNEGFFERENDSPEEAEKIIRESMSPENVKETIVSMISRFGDDSAVKICRALSFEPIQIEELAEKTGLELRLLMSKLTELEIEGAVKSCSGKRFVLVKEYSGEF